MHNSGKCGRENAESRLFAVIASEAKQSRTPPRMQSGLLRRLAPRNDGMRCLAMPGWERILAHLLRAGIWRRAWRLLISRIAPEQSWRPKTDRGSNE